MMVYFLSQISTFLFNRAYWGSVRKMRIYNDKEVSNIKKDRIKRLTGSVDGEKNGKSNVNNNLISIHFNSKLAI